MKHKDYLQEQYAKKKSVNEEVLENRKEVMNTKMNRGLTDMVQNSRALKLLVIEEEEESIESEVSASHSSHKSEEAKAEESKIQHSDSSVDGNEEEKGKDSESVNGSSESSEDGEEVKLNLLTEYQRMFLAEKQGLSQTVSFKRIVELNSLLNEDEIEA